MQAINAGFTLRMLHLVLLSICGSTSIGESSPACSP